MNARKAVNAEIEEEVLDGVICGDIQLHELGGRVRERLRDGVVQCLTHLANGFLQHDKNTELRKLLGGNATALPQLTPEEFYRQLLRLVYRFLFLFVAEDRGLISSDPNYLRHYSVSRFRRLVELPAAYTDHDDLWLSLRVLWKLLADDTPVQQNQGQPLAAYLGLPVLNGELFKRLDLDNYRITNHHLLEALKSLVLYEDNESSTIRRVNFTALDVEELGSVYESLLDYQPCISTSGSLPTFELNPGFERKTTGSYYTPADLVAELIRTALEPVVRERLERADTAEAKEQALLSIRVIDPACGSGNFLLAAARRLGKELARIRTNEDEPAPERVREAIRDVVTHCIYGVDKNPLAVELCRVALWIESHTQGKPLSFLDHHIRCGDSLVGVFALDVVKQGIPDEAFTPVSRDDKGIASALKKRNREARGGQMTFFLQSQAEPHRRACNLWTAAFFQPKTQATPSEAFITTEELRACLDNGYLHPCVAGQADALAHQYRFFHWPVEFPDVFANEGFDVVLSNPPWERIKLEEQEFFESRDAEIAKAQNAAERKRLIQQLRTTNPTLWQEYQDALHAAKATSRFLRSSGQYPLTGRGDINTYSVFAERMRALLKPGGRAGIIVPTGIATDDTNKHFFGDLVDRGELVSLFDFENREGLFPAVHSRYKFCLLTLTRRSPSQATASGSSIRVAFFSTRTDHLRDPRRVFTLTPKDIARINPNTRTLPVFRTRQDTELTRAIYERVPVLVDERNNDNPWGVRFLRMFDMSNDSHLFRTREELEREGFRLVGNRFVKGDEVYLPLYEAKMIWHYDHRYGTYEGVRSRSNTELPTPSAAQHADSSFLIQPWYWVPKEEVEKRLGEWKRGWLLGFRDVTNATNERTAIFSLLPRVGTNNKTPLMLIDATSVAMLISGFCSLTLDFIARQKMGGTSLGFFILRQLPVLPPDAYTPKDLLFIVPRVLELTYTAWDLKPFADDVWREADNTLREAIRRQWKENTTETGGHSWEPPEWIIAYPEIEIDPGKGMPLPPFRWDEARRARLRAELDAYYARLYGLSRKQLRYILDPADLTERELAEILDPWEEVANPLDPEGYAQRAAASDFPGETFRVLKEKERRKYGEYRTRRLILEAWER